MTVTAILIISLICTGIAYPVTKVAVRALGLERKNFKGKRIPAGFGLMLLPAALSAYVVMLLFDADNPRTWVFLTAVIGFVGIGLLDDVYGTREAGGFRGHLGLLRHGRVSTGLIKAAGGGLLGLALGAVIAGFDPVESLVNGFLIALAANMLNLLDLRPGRAVSCLWLGLLVLSAARMGGLAVWPELIPVLVPALLLTILDRSARVMLGDAGSNSLGAVLGLALAYEAGLTSKIVILLFMAAVHLYSEKHSISGLIEGNSLLRRVDRLLGER